MFRREYSEVYRTSNAKAIFTLSKFHSFVVDEKWIEKHKDSPCSICTEQPEKGSVIVKLFCNHYFHYSCLLPWLTEKDSCPMCRKIYKPYSR